MRSLRCHDLTSSSLSAIYILYRKSKNLPFGLAPWAWVLGPRLLRCSRPAPVRTSKYIVWSCIRELGGTKRTVFPQALIADNL